MAEISQVKTVGDVRRPELNQIGSYRTTPALPYDKNHPYIFSEGIGGDNWGKQPAAAPQSIQDAYFTVGSRDDITARIGAGSPGSLTQNTFKAGLREYDSVIW
jgi:hypothetical protein